MTDTTPRVGAPLLAASQAQKHVTHNEALYQFDAIVCARFIDRTHTAPPSSPADGDTYLVASGATGTWFGQDGNIAYCADGSWRFYPPFAGLVAYVQAESASIVFDGTSWSSFGGSTEEPLFGVNTTADSTNKLSVKSNAVLFADLDTAGGGTGDIRTTLSKEASGNTASFLFQDNFSGRAEIGLTGDDNFHFKVSPDGSAWTDALTLDKTSGLATLAGNPTASFGAATKQYVDALVPQGHIFGLTLSNDSGTPNTKIDVTAGMAADSTGAKLMKLASSGVVNFATTGANALDTGSIAASSWYHIFLIAKSDGTTALLGSLSATAPTLPSGYTLFRRAGSVLTDASAHLIAFTQVEDIFYLGTQAFDVNVTNLGATAVLYTLTVPTGVKVEPLIRAKTTTSSSAILLTSPDEADVAPDTSNQWTNTPGADVLFSSGAPPNFSGRLKTNTSGQIRARANGASRTLLIVTRGWIDSRGRNA